MPIVEFKNENVKLEVKKGISLARAARNANIFLETPCNGSGHCGKCMVKVSDLSALHILKYGKAVTEQEKKDHIVLACQSLVMDDVQVFTLRQAEKNKSLAILSNGMVREGELHPVGNEGYGVTVDIGTTTVVVELSSLKTGQVVNTESIMNPQCIYAQDVISRIQYCSENPDGLQTMYQSLYEKINELIDIICKKSQIDKNDINEVVYTGNTTMMHLVSNMDPYSLGRYPYTSKIVGNEYRLAKDCGLQLNDKCKIYFPPIISSFVGSDITAGVLACSLEKRKGTILFIDIGTNGEMVLASNGHLTATSTAAGPAFEGMNIEFGMRAAAGAIENFHIDDDYNISYHVIGDQKPVGICGSGLFDIVGELVRVGIIQKNGRIVKPERCTLSDGIKLCLEEYQGKVAFKIAKGVYLTLRDIRQVQLAKSAIRAGIDAMLGLNHMDMSQVDQVYIAGSFGYHLKSESLIYVGILPSEWKNRIKFVGNTSKTGGNSFLLNTNWRDYFGEVVKKIKTLELSDYSGFEELFVKYMAF